VKQDVELGFESEPDLKLRPAVVVLELPTLPADLRPVWLLLKAKKKKQQEEGGMQQKEKELGDA